MKTVYIAGYGRSGSTVLGILLGGHPNVVHVGESAFLFDELRRKGRTCSCGRLYPDCRFWCDLLPDESEWLHAARITRRMEGLSGLPSNLGEPSVSMSGAGYGPLHARLISRIRNRAGAEIVVDSSKSAWSTVGRFLALRRHAGEDVHVIHLVRSGRATMDSLIRTGSNWEIEGRNRPRRAPALRAAVGWTAVNELVGRLAAELPPERYLRVRYEDLIDHPVRTLGRIGCYVGLDLSPVIELVSAGKSIPVGHLVGGNRLRFDGDVKLMSSRDHEADSSLDRRAEFLFRFVGGSLERRYGYV